MEWELTDHRSQREWRGVAGCVRDAQTACQTAFRALGRLDLTAITVVVYGDWEKGQRQTYRAVATKRGRQGLVLMWKKDR